MSKTISLTISDNVYDALESKADFYEMKVATFLANFLLQSAEIEESKLGIKGFIDARKRSGERTTGPGVPAARHFPAVDAWANDGALNDRIAPADSLLPPDGETAEDRTERELELDGGQP